MRTTAVCLRNHLGRYYKYQWLRMSRRKVPDTGARAILSAVGIETVDPNDILTPAFNRPVIEMTPRIEEETSLVKKTPHYFFTNIYFPPGGLTQIQNLTNTITHATLPQSVLSKVEDSTDEEDAKVKEAIFQSFLLDSYQEKLPKFIDIYNRPGWNFPRTYGSPLKRKNQSLTYKLLLLLDNLHTPPPDRCLVTNTKTDVSLKHGDTTFYMNHLTPLLLASTSPLSPVAGEDEIAATKNEMLPDIHPFSPFLHCKKSDNYSDEECDSIASGSLFPRTLFIHKNLSYKRHSEDTLSGQTLLFAFSHAAAYAKHWCPMENGILKNPLCLQVIHTTGKEFHIGVFQLNTLDLCGPTKNIFWHHPIEHMYDECDFKVAQPALEGYNSTVFSLLKALHVQ